MTVLDVFIPFIIHCGVLAGSVEFHSSTWPGYNIGGVVIGTGSKLRLTFTRMNQVSDVHTMYNIITNSTREETNWYIIGH